MTSSHRTLCCSFVRAGGITWRASRRISAWGTLHASMFCGTIRTGLVCVRFARNAVQFRIHSVCSVGGVSLGVT